MALVGTSQPFDQLKSFPAYSCILYKLFVKRLEPTMIRRAQRRRQVRDFWATVHKPAQGFDKHTAQVSWQPCFSLIPLCVENACTKTQRLCDWGIEDSLMAAFTLRFAQMRKRKFIFSKWPLLLNYFGCWSSNDSEESLVNSALDSPSTGPLLISMKICVTKTFECLDLIFTL